MKASDKWIPLTLLVAMLVLAGWPAIKKARFKAYLAAAEVQRIQKRDRIKFNWATSHFVTLDITNLNTLADGVRLYHSELLTPLQRTELTNTFRGLLRAFVVGGYEEYLKFRKPIPASIDPQVYIIIEKVLTGVPLDQKDIDAVLLKGKDGKRIQMMKSEPNPDWVEPTTTQTEMLRIQFIRGSRGTEYKGWWKKLSPEHAVAAVQVVTSVPKPMFESSDSGIPEFGTNFWGMSGCGRPVYRFEETPDEILRTEGKLTYLASHWLVIPKSPDPVTPYLIGFYWSGKHGKWVPLEFSSSNVRAKERSISIPW